MTWDRSQLENVARRRLADRERLAPVEQAALAYARWQGLTDEDDVDAAAAKQALDAALDTLDDLGPDGWSGLTRLAEDLGDTAVIGLMRHSLSRSIAQLRDPAPASEPEADPPTSEPAPTPSKPRRRDKDR